MPFDGLSSNIDCLIAVDKMITFFKQPNSWCRNKLYRGHDNNPTQLCLRGALNYVVLDHASNPYVLWRNSNAKTWRQLNTIMKAVAWERHNSSHYIETNDTKLWDKDSVLDFLYVTRNRISA